MRDVDPAWWRSAALNARPMPTYLRERDFGAVFRFLRTRGWSRASIAAATGLSETRVREISTGRQRVTSYEVLERLADGLQIERGLVGLAYGPEEQWPEEPAADETADEPPAGEAPAGPGPVPVEAEPDPVAGAAAPPVVELPPPVRLTLIKGQRDEVTELFPELEPTSGPEAGTEVGTEALFSVTVGPGPAGQPGGAWPTAAVAPLLNSLTQALIGPHEDRGAGPLPTLPAAVRATARAKRHYQACDYDTVLRDLPSLLEKLDTLQEIGRDGGPGHTVAADAYHVAGSVLLKVGDTALATVAADRSMAAAQRSGDPIAVGASARILAHTLMSTGHGEQARQVAVRAATQLAADVPLAHSRPARSVYGALLLRGSIASARIDREGAYELLAEAAAVAGDIDDLANERWTAFGPTNVLLHRVNVALVLGDAGSAIDTARLIDLRKVVLAERRAAFFLDIAHAYHQWGRYDEAFVALNRANQAAPQEIRARPSAGRLVTEMAARAPITTRPRIHRLAQSAGIKL
jgi:transcriptional regulator with XRE-family HTH domain/tetratricopeptide (TPR) repeat protein